MNKSQAVAGNVTREEAAVFLREMGIESLRKRAGKIAEEIGTLYDFQPISFEWPMHPAEWIRLPIDVEITQIRLGLENGVIYWDTVHEWQVCRGVIEVSVPCFTNVSWLKPRRVVGEIGLADILRVCTWLAYINAREQPPF